LRARALAQIRDPIVARASIPVIDLSARVLTMNIEPSEPMRVVGDPVYVDGTISVVRAARFPSRKRTSPGLSPIKKPRFRGVSKHFSQALRAEAELHFAEHDGGPSKRKRPAADPAPGAIEALMALLN
jgi:hypothetical protein